jgi:hypothetical protein
MDLVALPLVGNLPSTLLHTAFEQDPFRAHPKLVCCLAFAGSELRKHSGVGVKPVCNSSCSRRGLVNLRLPSFGKSRRRKAADGLQVASLSPTPLNYAN